MNQPSPYSQVVEPIIVARDTKIRELEAELLTLKETVRKMVENDGGEGSRYDAKDWLDARDEVRAMLGLVKS